MAALFRGSGVALVTPFDERGINESVLRELIEFQVSEGTNALIVCGSTGEAATMTPEEQARVATIAVDAVAGRMPVVVGVGGSGTAAVVELARAAREAGADALLASAPPYNKPTQRGILAHYRAILAAADLPLIVYNVPGRTACNVLPETIEEMAADARVVGVKEASSDITQIAELSRRVGDRLAIYSGNDDQTVPILALGGLGVISVLANLIPREIAQMVELFLDGDVEGSRRLQLRYLPLIQTLFKEPNPVPVKAGVRALGFAVGEVRLPLTELTGDTRKLLLEQLRAVGVAVGVGV